MYTENIAILSSVSLQDTSHLWKKNDILIFFVDMDNYDILSIDYLNNAEREHLERLQTKYFRKRFIVSRVVLKHILCHLLNIGSVKEISTYKDNFGEVHILNQEKLYICMSYSENITTLSISKVKIGIDIEIKRSLALKNTLKYLQLTSSYLDKSASDTDFLKAWTIKEAYCKFSNKSLLSILNKESQLNNACCSNYLFDNKYVFSIVADSDSYNIDISSLEKINCI
jgi:4'-phosphopantetheinyl transferase